MKSLTDNKLHKIAAPIENHHRKLKQPCVMYAEGTLVKPIFIKHDSVFRSETIAAMPVLAVIR